MSYKFVKDLYLKNTPCFYTYIILIEIEFINQVNEKFLLIFLPCLY